MLDQQYITPLHLRKSSSLEGTAYLCEQLPALFAKYNIKSVFDAGANDAGWQAQTLAHMVEYHAGERNAPIVKIAKENTPEIDIRVHDMTKDPFPQVDLLFTRDVVIHLNNRYKLRFLKNWLASGIPWLLMTQINDCVQNPDAPQVPGEWYWADVNWHIDPWYFPPAIEYLGDLQKSELDSFGPNKQIQRFMCLWHRDQIKVS